MLPGALFVVGIAFVRAFNETGVTSWGYASCRCITYQDGALDAFNASAMQFFGVKPSEKLSHGIGCRAHDQAKGVCDAKHPTVPVYCHDSWCYVHQACALSKAPGVVRLGRWYSYATCGYVDRFISQMPNSILNVVLLSSSGGWKGSYCKMSEPTCSGATAELLNLLLVESHATVNVTAKVSFPFQGSIDDVFPREVLEGMRRIRPNETDPNWACWYATGMGFVDLCVLAANEAGSKLAVSPSLPLFAEPAYLVTKRQGERSTLLDYMFTFLRPFRLELWLAVFCSIMLLSYTLAWQEHNHGGMYEGVPIVSAIGDASYLGAKSFFEESCELNPRHVGGRLTAIGLAFLVMITVTSYTANLATYLIKKVEPGLVVPSWDAVLRNPSIKVCMKDSSRKIFTRPPWNLPAEQAVVFASRSEVIPKIGTAVCAAGISLYEDIESAQEFGHFCDIFHIGAPLFYSNRVAPISGKAYSLLRYHLANVVKSGQWTSILKKWRPSSPCQQAETSDDGYEGMEVRQMFGPLIIAVGFGALGIIVTVTRVDKFCASSKSECEEVMIPRMSDAATTCDLSIPSVMPKMSDAATTCDPSAPHESMGFSREELCKLMALQERLSISLEGAMRREKDQGTVLEFAESGYPQRRDVLFSPHGAMAAHPLPRSL